MLPRSFLLLSTLLGFNLVAVVGFVTQHYFLAEDTVVANSGVSPASKADETGVYGTETEGAETDGTEMDRTEIEGDELGNQAARSGGIDSAIALPAPGEFEIPSLPVGSVPPSPGQDPLFDELSDLTAEVYPDAMNSTNLLAEPPPLFSKGVEARSAAYYVRLGRRLQVVRQLNAAAIGLAAEAAECDEQGDTHQAQRLVEMTTKLRELAANLLVDEI